MLLSSWCWFSGWARMDLKLTDMGMSLVMPVSSILSSINWVTDLDSNESLYSLMGTQTDRQTDGQTDLKCHITLSHKHVHCLHLYTCTCKSERTCMWMKWYFITQTYIQPASQPEKQPDIQTDRQKNSQTYRQTDRKTARHTDRQTEKQPDRQKHRQTDRGTYSPLRSHTIFWQPQLFLLVAE